MASSVETFVNDDGYRCGYCYQLKNELVDPRILPCRHVFCLLCISSDYRQGSSLECPICRAKHTDIVIKDLPRYIDENVTRCKMCSHIAEMCCNQCIMYMCTQHAQQHDEAFASITTFCKHEKAVAISTGNAVCQGKGKQVCGQHAGEKIKRVCSICYLPLCMECVSSQKCGKDKIHTTEKIEIFCEKLKKELAQILSDLYVHTTVSSDLEKQANAIYADQESTLVEMKAVVDRVTKEQMEEIQEKASKVKSAIDENFKVSTDAIKQFCKELTANKDASDCLMKDIHNLINLKSDLDVIKEYKQSVEKSVEIGKSMPSELCLPFIDIKQLAGQRELGMEIFPTYKTVIQSPNIFASAYRVKEIEEPKNLSHSSSTPTSQWVWSVNWLSDELLACCFSGKIDVRDKKLNMKKSHSVKGVVWNVCPHGADYLVFLHDNGYKVDLYSGDFTYRKTVFALELGSSACHFAVNDNFVLLMDTSTNCVKLYTPDGGQTKEFDFQRYITYAFGIQFQNDNSLIVSDNSHGKVLKFILEDVFRPEWVCDGLNTPAGISIDTSGFIYVASWGVKTIYILSPSGRLLKQFSPLELFDRLRAISVSGEDLAVLSARGVQLFKIHFDV